MPHCIQASNPSGEDEVSHPWQKYISKVILKYKIWKVFRIWNMHIYFHYIGGKVFQIQNTFCISSVKYFLISCMFQVHLWMFFISGYTLVLFIVWKWVLWVVNCRSDKFHPLYCGSYFLSVFYIWFVVCVLFHCFFLMCIDYGAHQHELSVVTHFWTSTVK